MPAKQVKRMKYSTALATKKTGKETQAMIKVNMKEDDNEIKTIRRSTLQLNLNTGI